MKRLPAPDPADAPNRLSLADLPAEISAEPGGGDLPSGGLLEYWRIIQRRKGLVIVLTILGLITGFLYTLPQTPIYQARTVIEIQALNEDFLHMKDVNPNDTGAGGDQTVELQTQVEILQSRALLERVTNKMIAEAKPFKPTVSTFDAWRAILHLPAPASSRRESAIDAAAGGLRIRAQAGTRLIEILDDSSNPGIAADFVNTLTSEFIEQSLEARWKSTEHTGEWLGNQMQDLKVKLEKSEDALQSYARATNLVVTDEKENSEVIKMTQLQQELSSAQNDRITRQSRYELATHAPPDSLGEILDDAALQEIEGKLVDLRRQMAELSASFTPSHPKVQKLQAQISILEAALQNERLNILGRIRNDYEAAERREKLLAADYAGVSATVTAQADKMTHYNTLKREVDTNRQVYDSILERVKEAGVASALRASNINVVDPAVPPGGPYKPDIFHNSTMGLFAGFLFSVGLVVLLDRADRTIQEPGDASFYLGVPELGIVPTQAEGIHSSGTAMPRVGLQQAISNREKALVTRDNRPSAMAESFRATITSIMFSGQNGSAPQVLVVSSSAPHEGKTTLTTNLAVALAEINKRVLLIDADLRRPSVHHYFNLDKDKGLVDLLRLREPIPTPLNGHVQDSGVPNLSIMAAGRSVDGDPTLFHSNRLEELIDIVRKDYDMILIDTPPMLNMSDARVIARHSDGVVLVVRANVTSRAAIRDAHRRFVEDGTLVLGTVLNDWNPKKSTRYSYYRYHDRYRHYYRASEKDSAA